MSPKPRAMAVQPDNIPALLKDGKHFIVWRWEFVGDRWTKPPYHPSGRHAKSNDPDTWVSFEEALAAHKSGEFDGIGRCFVKDDPFTAFDLDKCRGKDGKPELWAAAMMTRLNTYTEITPSGTGYRPWVIAQKPGPRSGRKNPDIEIYDCTSRRYLCLTGHALNGHRRIEPRQAETNEIYREMFEAPAPQLPQEGGGPFVWDGAVDSLPVSRRIKGDILNGWPKGERSEPMMGVLNALVWSNLTDSQIFDVFEQHGCGEKYRQKGDGRQAWLRPQIEKARGKIIERAKPYKQLRHKERGQEQCTSEPGDESGTDLDPECFLELLVESDDDGGDSFEWLVEKLLPKAEPMIIGGKGGSGKSTLALELAAQVMEEDTEACSVYIAAEGTLRDSKVRARQMGITKFGRFHFLIRKGGGTAFKLSEDRDLKLVSSTLAKAKQQGIKIVFVVIDSIRGMQKGSLSDDFVGEAMQSINAEVCQKLGATVCYIHHSKKNTQDVAAMDALLGSVFIVNSVRHALFIKKQSSRVRTVEVCKSNLGFEDHYFKAELGDDKRITLQYQGVLGDDGAGVDDTQLDRAEEVLLSMLGEGEAVPAFQIYNRGELEGISAETMRRAKKLHTVDVMKRGKVWMWHLKKPILEIP